MTLNLAALTHDAAIQSSDRRSSWCRRRPDGRVDFLGKVDPLTNKQVVFHASDAIVSIAIAGASSVGGISAGAWVLGQLMARAPGRSWDRIVEIAPHEDTFARAIRRLIEAMRHSGEPIELSVVGWRITPRSSIGICLKIVRHETGIHVLPRARRGGARIVRPVIDVSPRLHSLDKRSLSLLRKASASGSPADVVDACWVATRSASAVSPTVGSDILAIVIPRPIAGEARKRTITVSYRGMDGRDVVITDWAAQYAMDLAFSPWIAGNTATPPLAHNYARAVRLGDFPIVTDAPRTKDGPLAFVTLPFGETPTTVSVSERTRSVDVRWHIRRGRR